MKEPDQINKLPGSPEAERGLLAGLMLKPEKMYDVIQVIDEEAFILNSHRLIFRALKNLFTRGKEIDTVIVGEELKRMGELEKIGGMTFLASIVDNVASIAYIDEYVKIIEDKYLKRRMIDISSEILKECYQDNEEAVSLLDRFEQNIFSLRKSLIRKDVMHIKDFLKPIMKELEDRKERALSGSIIRGIPTPFTKLNELTAGFQKGDLIILAGRPSKGKTSLSLNFALHAAMEENKGVLIFSLEMAGTQLTERMICMKAQINMMKFHRADLSQAEILRVISVLGELMETPIYIDDTANTTVIEMNAKARKLMMNFPISMIIIDYLQLIAPTPSKTASRTRAQEVSDITRELKIMAKDLDIPIIVLSQLSRRPEQREEQRPRLSDLRESGSIEQDADVVLTIYNESSRMEEDNIVTIEVLKQRNGPRGKFPLYFERDTGLFREPIMSLEEEPEIPEDIL